MHFVRQSVDVQQESVGAGRDTVRQVLIGPGEGPNFHLRKFRIEPGGFMPFHKNSVEHEQYVLGGRARVRIAGDTFDVKADDVVLIPAGVPHSYEAVGNEPFEFLCVVPNGPDRLDILDE
ncbi:MAG: cupin domain-containing protein [Gemmatimonadota bacterium]